MTNNRIQRYTVSGDIAYPIHEDPEGDYVTYEDHVAAIKADRQRRGEPVYLLAETDGMWSETNEATFLWWKANSPRAARVLYTAPQPAEPDYKQLFEQMCERCDALDAKLAEYSEREPVAWRVHPFDYGIGHEGVYALTSRPDQVAAWERKGWEVQPLFTAPQPAESCESLMSDKTACGSDKGDCDSQPTEPEHATLNLQPSSSLQPVATAFFTERGEVAYTGIYDRTLKALEAVKTTRMGISSGSIDLYAAPQAAESVKVPSDAEIGQILKEVLHNSRYGVHQWELWLEFASALFTRYGGGTP